MTPKTRRTITEVLDYETGECIDADIFFCKPLDEIIVYRSRLQKAIENFSEPIFGCYYCKQKIRIRGGVAKANKRKADMFHFAHLKDSDECHIKTKNKLTKEEIDKIRYNGAKESPLHQTLKNNIAECLRKNEMSKNEVSSIEVEKVIRDKVAKEWKKPDVNAFYNGKRIAIELQLSTTWLDVITKRQHFYKEQGIYIFWVFHTFNENDDVRKLTYNDVVYTNNQNAYIFNEEIYELSKSKNDLFLKCFYKTYLRDKLEVRELWKNSIIRLSDLTFDEQNFRIYYHDSETQKKNVEQEIAGCISEIQKSKQLKILENQKKEKERQEQQRKQDELESKIQDIKEHIENVIEIKNNIKQKESKSEGKLIELNDIVSKANEYADKTVKYFTNQQNSRKPLYDHDDLIKSLMDEFEKQIKNSFQTIIDKKQEAFSVIRSLDSISKLPTFEISNKVYSSISNTNHWDFIKENYSQIKVIHKSHVNQLFNEVELKLIKSSYELYRYQYAKDIYFLIDFSYRIAELNLMKKKNQEIISQHEKILSTLTEKIKTKIEMYFEKEIAKLEINIKAYSDRQTELRNEIDIKKSELKNLELT